ncbi:hypothetical protein HK28_12920 [Acetobacter sp. DsW_063]|nr:hypothetical protein HK28_12920 [Acetobacter sp. DsW_063]
MAPYVRAEWHGPFGHHVIIDVHGQLLRAVLIPISPGHGRAFIVRDDAYFDLRMESAARVHRVLAGNAPGPAPAALRLSAQQRQRQIRMLCAIDGRRAGIPYRRIAGAMFRVDLTRMSADEWRATAYYAAFHRLLRDSKIYLNGGHLSLLQGTARGGDTQAA